MKIIKLKIVLLTVLYFFLRTSFAQSQTLSKLIYWNGENLEMAYAKINPDNGELLEFYYQENTQSEKLKLPLIANEGTYTFQTTHPKTQEKFRIASTGMSIEMTSEDNKRKEFLYGMEFVNGNEKIIMGSMPILGEIVYQKGNNAPELWLDNPDIICKAGEKEGRRAFLCNFTTLKGEELQLMIEQGGKKVTLWRNGKMQEFYGK